MPSHRNVIDRRGLTAKLLVVSIASLCMLVFRWATSVDHTQPALIFSPPSLSFGDSLQNEMHTVVGRIRNTSMDPVRIVGIESSCGCTVAADGLIGCVVGPKETRNIPININTGQADGHLSSTVAVIYIDGPSKYAAAVDIHGTVRPEYQLMPKSIDFGIVHREGVVVSRTVQLRGVGGQDAQITSVRSTHSEFCARICNGSAHTVIVDYRAPQTEHVARTTNGILYITTSSPRTPLSSILLRARYEPSISAAPTSIVVVPPVSKGVLETVTVTSLNLSRIAEASCPHPAVQLLTNDDDTRIGLNHQIVLRVNRPRDSKSFHTVLNIVVEDRNGDPVGGRTSIVVPVHYLGS